MKGLGTMALLLVFSCFPSLLGAIEPAFAAGAWRFGGRTERFVLYSESGIPFAVRISEACASEAKEKSRGAPCEALGALRRAASIAFQKEKAGNIRASNGGAEPGSLICRGAFGASVFLAEDEGGNRNAFCTFPDGSRVSTGSLASVWAYAARAGSR